MHRILSILTLAALLLVQMPARADELALGLFEQYLDALRRQAGIPGMAAVLAGGEDIVWEGAFGHQDTERAIAARPDTPFHTDGLTQIFTAAILLRCAEEGQLPLDAPVGTLVSTSTNPGLTVRQLLTHTNPGAAGPVYEHQPERLSTLTAVARACHGGSYRKTLAGLLERFAMRDSVPGPDVLALVPPAEGIPTPAAAAHYATVLERLAAPYAVDGRGRVTRSAYSVVELTPSQGLIASARDLARFDLALRKGAYLLPQSLAAAWNPPATGRGQPLPHGMGWFVQSYKGELVVWQFGVSDNASSSLIMSVPRRGVTVVLMANSDGLVRPFPLSAGDLTVSPFGRLFVRFFIG